MHELLSRQIAAHLGGRVPPELAAFVAAVEHAYRDADEPVVDVPDAGPAGARLLGRRNASLLALGRHDQLRGSDPRQVLARVCETVAAWTGAVRVSVWRLDGPPGGVLLVDEFDAAAGTHRHDDPLPPPDEAPWVAALGDERTVVVADASTDARTGAFWRALGRAHPASALAAPLRSAGRVSGLLWLEDAAVARVWSDEDRLFAFSAGAVAALALEACERVRADVGRRDGDDRLRLLTQNMSDLVCLHGLDGRLHYVSPSALRLLGYSPEELLAIDPLSLVHPDDQERTRLAFASTRARPGDKRTATRYRLRRKDGGWAWLETLAEPIIEADGQVRRLQTSSREVTERVLVEQNLAVSEQRYRLVVEHSVDGIVLCDAATLRIVEANPSYQKLVGYGLEELRQMTLGELAEGGDRPLRDSFGQRDGHPEPTRGDFVQRRRDGTTVEVSFSAVPICAGGQALVLGVLTDVSAQRKTQMLDEDRRRVLEMVAKSQPLAATMLALSVLVRRQCPGLECRVLRAGDDSAASRPSLTGPGQQWALPILSGAGQVLGCLIASSDARRSATDADVATLQTAAQLAGIAIEQAQLTDRLAFQAQHDALTGLPNRRFFEGHVAEALRQAETHGTGLALLFIDLDRFKQVNDTLGHAAGDRLLVEVAKRLRSAVRLHDLVARMGGDEFTVILQDLSEPAEAVRFARRLLGLIGAPLEIAGEELFVTASIGISVHPQDGSAPDALLRHADIAMYRAKSRGRNGVECFTPELNAAVTERFSLEVPLRHAIENRELRLNFQPQFDRQGGITGFEALLRWHHPKLGLISPGRFVPLAEESGLIVPIGSWVLKEAFDAWARWRRAGMPALQLAVNVSAVQFAQPEFVSQVAGTLAACHVDPREIELELTESVLMHDVAESSRRLTALRSIGVKIAIDDFGTGYASLSYLHRLPVDTLKIDQSFVRELDAPGGTRPLVEAIVAMGRSLGLGVIAEGVETAAQLAILRELGCERAQGFLMSAPVDEAAVGALLESQRLLGGAAAAAGTPR